MRFTVWHVLAIILFAVIMRAIIALAGIAVDGIGLWAVTITFAVMMSIGVLIERREPKSRRPE